MLRSLKFYLVCVISQLKTEFVTFEFLIVFYIRQKYMVRWWYYFQNIIKLTTFACMLASPLGVENTYILLQLFQLHALQGTQLGMHAGGLANSIFVCIVPLSPLQSDSISSH